MIVVSKIGYHPLKSAKGFFTQSAQVDERGIVHDREWMVVDENGMFVAQRSDGGLGIRVVSMCLIQPHVVNTTLVLSIPTDANMGTMEVPIIDGEVRAVQVWNNANVQAIDQGDLAAEWLTDFLGRERKGRYRLVRRADAFLRPSKNGQGALSFGDAFPITLHRKESHDDVNKRIVGSGGVPIPDHRWRSNLILETKPPAADPEFAYRPFLEDHMQLIRVGEIELISAGPCARCPIPCTDQETGSLGLEPNATLAKYRRGRDIGIKDEKKQNAVFFAQNYIHLSTGVIAVDDEVSIIEWSGNF